MKLAKKLAVVAIVASIPFAAHARNAETGVELARCAGTFISYSAVALKAGDAKASNKFSNVGLHFVKTSNLYIDPRATDQIASSTMRLWGQRINSNLPNVGNMILRDMDACVNLANSL